METSEKKTYGYNPTDYKKFKSWAWKMLLSFGMAYMFFYNGRQNINLVMTEMAEDLGSTTAAMGIVSSALFWTYAIGNLLSGRLGAKFGYKRYMTFGVIGSIILNIVISFQHSVPVITVLWALNGFCQSTMWSNGVGVLNKWWPKDKRGFASGLATTFSGLSQIFAYLSILLCLELTPEWGWRAAFRLPLVPLAICLVAFIVLFKEKPEDVGLAPYDDGDQAAATRDAAMLKEINSHGFWYPYKVLLKEPKVIIFCLISAIAGVGRYGLITWIPTYFTESMGLSIKSGIVSSILLPVGQACAMFVFPFLTDKVFHGKREPMLALASVVTFVGMICFPFVNTQGLASALLLFVGISSMVTGIVWAVAGDLGGRAFAATVSGVLNFSVYLGAAVQASVFGFFKDTFGWPSIFIIIGVLYVIMLVLALACRNIKLKNL